tara:strand:+ start:41252 stop:42298 length:1047 start_codon:yes stop_codon:yes gene_type:complete
MGRNAADRIGREGWSPDHFDLLLGASGGPKWFILGQLDRLLFGDFLQRGQHPLSALGSSIGSWRHACLAQSDPVAAINRLEHAYLHQNYAGKPSVAEVSAVSLKTLQDVLQQDGARQILQHPRIQTHIVTARGRGPAAASSSPLLATGMGAAALGNSVSRHLLKLHFQRVVFHSQTTPRPLLAMQDFNTCFSELQENSVAAALHASGAIPFVLTGERNIPGAPPGQYWDGGIIDYHFDLSQYRGHGLILYPHFSATLIPGWFDKFLPWRRAEAHSRPIDDLVLLSPSEPFIAELPQGKIPDRSDFTRLPYEERVAYWETCIERSKAMAEEFFEQINRSDPLQDVHILR